MAEVDLKGNVALVTGGSLGIGRATCVALGRAGAHVAVNYRTHELEAEEVAQAVRDDGSRAMLVQGDTADQQAVEQIVTRVVDHFGKLDIVVVNAAYSTREPFVEANMDGFRRTIDVTMWGAFYPLRATAAEMIRSGTPGTIVLVSSPHANIPVAGSMAYNMAKAAVEAMAKTAALELASHQIRVNVIQPGWVDTPGQRKMASEETLLRAGRRIPTGRLGTPEEIAHAILFLCDPHNEYITGSMLRVDGGITLPWWAGDAEIPRMD